MQLNQATSLLMGVGFLTLFMVMGGIMIILRNQARYASFDKMRYDNLLKLHMVDLHNRITSDLSDIFTRYLLLRKGSYHDTGIVIEAMVGTVQGQLEGIIAHFNHELKNSEQYKAIDGIEFEPNVATQQQSDRVVFTLRRKNGSSLDFTLCNPTYFGPMLTAELDQYRTKLRDRIYTRSHRQFESMPQTYLSYAASKMHKEDA